MLRRRVIVHGRVQGVGFRYAVARAARARGLGGWVRNRPDGAVEAVFEGEPEAVEALVGLCSEGPRGAEVTDVEVLEEQPEGLRGFEVGGGRVTDVIAVVPYDPEWPRRFEVERALLERVLEPWLEGGIHHIGSTAIPGISAKPIIDMIAGVRNFEEARAAYTPLEAAGYVDAPHRPGIAHHFAKPSRDRAELGLHLTEPGSDLWRERLGFRDALRADPTLAAEYEQLKLRLAREHAADVTAYTGAKRAFVARVLAPHGIELGRR